MTDLPRPTFDRLVSENGGIQRFRREIAAGVAARLQLVEPGGPQAALTASPTPWPGPSTRRGSSSKIGRASPSATSPGSMTTTDGRMTMAEGGYPLEDFYTKELAA